MKSMTREAYRLINRVSGQFELEVCRCAQRLAEEHGGETVERDHVTIALQELIGNNLSPLQHLLDAENCSNDARRAG